jgi:hypothetical protein
VSAALTYGTGLADGMLHAVRVLRANAAKMRRLLDEHPDGSELTRAETLGAAKALEFTAADLEQEALR